MKKFKLAGVLRVLALILVVSLIWCYLRDRSALANWKVPINYNGDATQVLAWAQAAAEGEYLPLSGSSISRLGAPYIAEWNDFPMFERPLIGLMGLLTKCFGLFIASNISVLLAYVTTAVSFYLCCRFLKYSKLWSWVGAVLFAFTYYHYFTELGHLLQAFSYTLPWALLSCWIVAASQRIELKDTLAKICLVTALVMGFSDSYNLVVYFQLLGFAVLAQYFSRRRTENLRIGLLMFALAMVSFLAMNVSSLTYAYFHGRNPGAMDRHYLEAELYALKPMEFFIPPANHRIYSLAMMGKNYAAAALVKGEMFSPYLGIVSVVGLVWICAEAFLFMVREAKPKKKFPPYAPQIFWIMLYAIIGGLNCLMHISGLQYFRSTNRVSVVISAMVLMFLASRLTRLSRRWSPAFSLTLAALALFIGVADELPSVQAKEEANTIEGGQMLESDRDFGRQIEEKLPPRTMVFQLPVMAYPEAIGINGTETYDMLRPYCVTKTLRFSFGSVRGRNRDAWQWEVEKLPAPEMIAALQSYGFGAIYIDLRGYQDHGEELLKQFASAGLNPICMDSQQRQVCLQLKPSPTPVLPQTDLRAQLVFANGWAIKQHTPLQNIEWTSGDAKVSYFSESKNVANFNLRCVVGSITPRRVSIESAGRELWSGEIPPGRSVPVDITITGHPRYNDLFFKTDTAPATVKDYAVPLAINIGNLQITRLSVD